MKYFRNGVAIFVFPITRLYDINRRLGYVRLVWYKSYLLQYRHMKRIVEHIARVTQSEAVLEYSSQLNIPCKLVIMYSTRSCCVVSSKISSVNELRYEQNDFKKSNVTVLKWRKKFQYVFIYIKQIQGIASPTSI